MKTEQRENIWILGILLMGMGWAIMPIDLLSSIPLFLVSLFFQAYNWQNKGRWVLE